jgi:hypothetical protein
MARGVALIGMGYVSVMNSRQNLLFKGVLTNRAKGGATPRRPTAE